jgi:hypothetical protein
MNMPRVHYHQIDVSSLARRGVVFRRCLPANRCRLPLSGPAPDAAASNVAAATKETEDWRAQHEKSYRENWATIAGLHFIEAG